jgi:hydroxylamine reductase
MCYNTKRKYKKRREIIMAKITADTLIADVLQINPNSPEILLAAGMHCFGCALAHNETVAEAVAVHGEDLEALLAKLNAGLED